MQFFSALILCAPCSINHLCCWGVLSRSMRVWPGISLARLVSGSGLVFVAPAVARRLVGCRSAPLVLFCSQSFPQQRGQPWFLPGLYPTQWGAPDSSAHQPNLYACKMYIWAVSKQGHSHFWEDISSRFETWVFSDWAPCFRFFGETDNRVLIVRMN